MKPARHLLSLVVLLCFIEVLLPDAIAQQPEEVRKAFQEIKADAEKGDAFAQSTIGWMYGHGDGVEKDYVEAAKWYRKSADQGYPPAQFFLGVMYEHGNGVRKDYAEAVKWYRKAADQGFDMAQAAVGNMYPKGNGVAKGETEAVDLRRESLVTGHGKIVVLSGVIIAVGIFLAMLTKEFVAPIPHLQDPKRHERTGQERKEYERKEYERKESEHKEHERQNRTAVFDCIGCGTAIRLRLQGAAVHRCPSCKMEYKTIQAAGEPTVLLVVPTSIHRGKSSEKKSQQKRAMPPDIRSALVALGLSEEASFEDVRGAYREHVKQYHPDKVSHLGADLRKLAETKTKEFNTAYAKLEKFYASS